MGRRPWLRIRLPGELPRVYRGRSGSRRAWLGRRRRGDGPSPGRWVIEFVEDREREANFGVIAVGPFEESGVEAKVVYAGMSGESTVEKKRRGRGWLA